MEPEIEKKIQELLKENTSRQQNIRYYQAYIAGYEEEARSSYTNDVWRAHLVNEIQEYESAIQDAKHDIQRVEEQLLKLQRNASAQRAVEEKKVFLTEYRKVVQQKRVARARFVRFNSIGINRSGKSTFWDRLKGKEVKYSNNEAENPSTGQAQCSTQMIRLRKGKVSLGIASVDCWSELQHSDEVTMIQHIFSEIASDSTSTSDGPAPSSHDSSTGSSGSPLSSNLALDDSSRSANTTASDGLQGIIDALNAVQGSKEDWDNSKIKYELENMILLSSADTGGHAEFQDMHASLLSGPSFNLIFHRLIDKLNKSFPVYFTDEDGNSTKRAPSTSSVIAVLLQAVSSIACYGNFHADDTSPAADDDLSDLERDLKSLQSKVMFVGTFLDQVNGSDKWKVFMDRDDSLRKILKSTSFYYDLVLGAKEDQLMLAVGNGCGMEMPEVREILLNHIVSSFEPIRIPAAWLVLSLCLRIHEKPTMKYAECQALAEKLNIDTEKELKLALWFLHHGAGVLHYFSEVEDPEVRDTVFCQAMVVYGCVSDIIKAYSYKRVNEESHKFQDTGKFSLKKMESGIKKMKQMMKLKKMESSESESVPLRMFVKILEYLNIIACVDRQQEEFFMPCVLESLKEEHLKVPQHSSEDPAPLMLQYACGYMPVGVFPAMFTNLVAQQKKLGWSFLDEAKAYKNMVRFKYNKSGDVIYLIAHLCYFEIAVHRNTKIASCPIESVCCSIRETICDTLTDVISKMNYQFSTDIKLKLGFECSLCKEETSEGGEDLIHLALLDEDESSFMTCCKDKAKTKQLQDCHRKWQGPISTAGEAGLSSSCSLAVSPKGVPLSMRALNIIKWKDAMGQPHKFQFIKKVKAQWKRLGVILGLESGDLDGWAKQYHENAEECWLKVMEHWLNAGNKDYPATWEGLYTLLEDADYTEIAHQLQEAVTMAGTLH